MLNAMMIGSYPNIELFDIQVTFTSQGQWLVANIKPNPLPNDCRVGMQLNVSASTYIMIKIPQPYKLKKLIMGNNVINFIEDIRSQDGSYWLFVFDSGEFGDVEAIFNDILEKMRNNENFVFNMILGLA